MQIHGLNKTTLLDYPGLVASTVFCGNCNFRCPFCQNSDLVLNPASQPVIPMEEVLNHFRKRKGIIEGVCITGGEPTLHEDLEAFISEIKELGLKVKLDTNGYRPMVLKRLIESKLIDYVAMDIKSSFSRYSEAAGINIDTSLIKDSIDYLKLGRVNYEFRTTVVKELHDAETFREIAVMLQGADKYFLQGFIASDRVLKPGLSSYSREELEQFLPIVKESVKQVSIRGVE